MKSRAEATSCCAIITGAGGELGRAFADLLSKTQNTRLILTDIDTDAAHQARSSVERNGGEAVAAPLDVTQPSAWQQLVEDLHHEYQRVEMLINCAGIGAGGIVEGFSPEQFNQVFNANYFGTLYGCQAVIPRMKEQGHGHIVNVASITGLLAPPSVAAYASSKAAVVSLTEALYGELKPYGIGVTLCVPGFFRSPLIENGIFTDEGTQKRGEDYADKATLTAKQVAEETLRAVRKRRLYAVMGRRARWYWRIKRLAPQWLADKLSARYRN
ncbi:MAG: SDR family NAD(P)-dependent oxidoreductase [Lacipirellulaceae bacterium]